MKIRISRQPYPNAKLWYYGHCSLDGVYNFPAKEFGISTVTGSKRTTTGHLVRTSYYNRQDEIKIPKRFYISSRSKLDGNFHNNPYLGAAADDKMKLFSTMFHLCIENSVEPNYFTEKIIDCVRCKTIPIYYGCPNIQDFLDIKGIIRIDEDVSKGIDLINKLTPGLYDELLPTVEENYILAEKFINFPKRLKEFIGMLIK